MNNALKTQITTMFFKNAPTMSQSLEHGFLTSKNYLKTGLFGWLFENEPVFLFEKNGVNPSQWQVHFTHHCGYTPTKQQWIGTALDGDFSFKGASALAFCPHCIALVDRLFSSNILHLGLENNYDPANFFSNLTRSFPYLFWTDSPKIPQYKPSYYTKITQKLKQNTKCHECDYIADTTNVSAIHIHNQPHCLGCASSKKPLNVVIDYHQLTHHYANMYTSTKPVFSSWKDVQHFLPPVWGQLLIFFDDNNLPLPELWKKIEPEEQLEKQLKEQPQDLLIPLYWPELGKAVVMELPDSKITAQIDIEFWSFFDVLTQ